MDRAKEDPMKKALIFAAFLAMASPALATHCPTIMKKIDETMKTAQLEDMKKQAAQLCAAGNTQESLDVSAEAKAMLNID